MALYSGMGYPIFETTNLTPNLLLPINPIGFEIAGESETIRSRKFDPTTGKIVTAGSRVQSETYKVTLTIEAIDWAALEFAYGRRSSVATNRVLPKLKYATVPVSAPYEIVDADLTAANIANGAVLCSVTQRGTWGNMAYLTEAVGAPSAGQFQVDTANTKLIFNAAQAGSPIAYRYRKTHASVRNLGLDPNAAILDTISFSGIGFGDEFESLGTQITIPRMTRSGIPTRNFAEVTSLEINFDIIQLPGQPFFYEDEVPA